MDFSFRVGTALALAVLRVLAWVWMLGHTGGYPGTGVDEGCTFAQYG